MLCVCARIPTSSRCTTTRREVTGSRFWVWAALRGSRFLSLGCGGEETVGCCERFQVLGRLSGRLVRACVPGVLVGYGCSGGVAPYVFSPTASWGRSLSLRRERGLTRFVLKVSGLAAIGHAQRGRELGEKSTFPSDLELWNVRGSRRFRQRPLPLRLRS